VINNRKEERSR